MSIIQRKSTQGRHALPITPAFNVDPLLDYQNGTVIEDINGMPFMMGGFHHMTGIAGDPNVGKSVFASLFMNIAVGRHTHSLGEHLDTENTYGRERGDKQLDSLMVNCDDFNPIEILDDYTPDDALDFARIALTRLRSDMSKDSEIFAFDDWWNGFKSAIADLVKQNAKDQFIHIPVSASKYSKAPIKVRKPTFVLIDSLTEATVSAAIKTATGEVIDDKRNKMEAMTDGRIKNLMLSFMKDLNIPNLNINISMTAAIHKPPVLDAGPMAKPSKKLTHLAPGERFRRTSANFDRLTHEIIRVYKPYNLWDGNKFPNYPLNSSEKFKGNPDLQIQDFAIIRGKSSESGKIYQFIKSQKKGVLFSLSHFNYLRQWGDEAKYKDYGLITPKANFYGIAFLPEVSFSRHTIRETIDTNSKLRCGLRLLTELKQIVYSNPQPWYSDAENIIEPIELYEVIKEKGYDWDILLDTRGHWLAVEEEYDAKGKRRDGVRPLLTAMALIKMAKTDFRPFWYDEVAGAK